MGKKEDFCRKILIVFLEQATQKLEEISKHLDSRNFEKVQFIAHSLKGISYNVSANALGKTAEKIEQSIKNRQIENLDHFFHMLHEEYGKFNDAVSIILKNEKK